jgi:capsular polysaccharide transport system permease protein
MSSVTVIKRNKWEIWKDVVFALLAREIKTGFSDKFGLSWAIINPLAFIFILSFLRSSIGGPYTHTLETFTFMAIGIMFIQSFIQTFGAAAVSINKSKALFAFRQVQPISAVIAATTFQFLIKLFTLIGLIFIMFLMEMELAIDNGILFITCFSLLSVLAFSFGLMFGIAELYVLEIRKVRELLTRPLFFISGSFFSLQDFPRDIWPYLNWNPILHAIELARYSVKPTYGMLGVSMSYLLITVLSCFFVSLCVYFVSWKSAISR